MPGTIVRDDIAAELYDGTVISTATTTTGSAVEVDYPLDCQVEVALGTLTGAATTCDIEIQAADVSNFATKVSLGRFKQFGPTDDDTTHYLKVWADKKYLRAVIVTAGGSPSYTPTVTVRPPHYKRTATTTA